MVKNGSLKTPIENSPPAKRQQPPRIAEPQFAGTAVCAPHDAFGYQKMFIAGSPFLSKIAVLSSITVLSNITVSSSTAVLASGTVFSSIAVALSRFIRHRACATGVPRGSFPSVFSCRCLYCRCLLSVFTLCVYCRCLLSVCFMSVYET